jgi:glycosyltransferase involved in cell wall biosynthesis
MTVTHIVPTFAPVIDGVGDYALNLARQLRAGHGIDSRIIVCDARWSGPAEVDGFAVDGPTGFDARSLGQALKNATTVILHYVGYGFHARGIPTWLTTALEKWATAQTRLVTVFHEIWSAGPPWRTVFYLAPLQKKIARKILNLSAHAFISTAWAARLLETLKPGAMTQLPVSSNVDLAANNRARASACGPWRPIFFGQTWTRLPAVERHARLLGALHAQGAIDQVLVMGKESSDRSEDVLALGKIVPPEKISVLGERSAAAAASGFAEADFLLSSHRGRDICKSSAALSAVACGCPIVAVDADDSAPLVDGTHFLGCDASDQNITRFAQELANGKLPAISAAARAWYFENAAWPIIAAKIAAQLSPQTSQMPRAAQTA